MPPIICQRTDNHWSAWFADSPETAFGGEWPAEAIQWLAATVPGLDVENITADHEHSSDDRLVFVPAAYGVCSESPCSFDTSVDFTTQVKHLPNRSCRMRSSRAAAKRSRLIQPAVRLESAAFEPLFHCRPVWRASSQHRQVVGRRRHET